MGSFASGTLLHDFVLQCVCGMHASADNCSEVRGVLFDAVGWVGEGMGVLLKGVGCSLVWLLFGNIAQEGWGVLRAACCVLRAACCVLRAACCVLRAACCVLRAACCVLRAACCVLRAACCVLRAQSNAERPQHERLCLPDVARGRLVLLAGGEGRAMGFGHSMVVLRPAGFAPCLL